jgi:thiol:disulfide interchange protein
MLQALTRILQSRLLAVLLLAVLLLIARPAAAQLPEFGKLGGGLLGRRDGNESKVTVQAEFTPATPDAPARLFVTAKIQPGYHLYALDQGKLPDGSGPQATAISLDGGQPVKLLGAFRPVQAPATHVDTEAWEGLELREHEGTVVWHAPIEFAAEADPRQVRIRGTLEGQACDPHMCIPVEIDFTAGAGEGVPLPVDPVQAVAEPATADLPLLAIAGYGLLGGLILNLMPCVLPVIGLKLFSFAKQGGQSRRHILALNLSYSAGLLAVFMVLATLAAAVQLGLRSENLGWGQIYTYTWFKVSMTALVFAMALSFLGIWELPIPGFATSGKASALAAQEGMFGAFCMGAITTLLAVPCSGPFLGPVFGYTLGQPPLVTYIIFASVALGMASPYLLIGAFPSLISWLPKPGAWMETLKNLLGFALLATVVYLFSTIDEGYFIATLALLVGIWFACWAIARVPPYESLGKRAKAWGLGIAVASIVGVVSFKFLTPSESPLPWQPYTPQALALARAQGKTVLVEFTADWCLTCQVNRKFAIERDEVKQLVEQNDVVTLLADWTDRSKLIENALAELNSRSIPLLAVYPADPAQEVIVLPDLLTQADVLDALKAAGPSLDAERATLSARQGAALAPITPELGAVPPTASTR